MGWAMNDDELYALGLVSSYDLLGEKREEIEHDYMPHYGLYHRTGNHQEVFCTHCRDFFYISTSVSDAVAAGLRTFSVEKAKHGERTNCPRCGEPIKYLADGRGRRGHRAARNFMIFRAVSDEELAIRCYRVEQTFMHPDSGKYFVHVDGTIFDFWEDEVARYYFRRGEAPMKFTRQYDYHTGKYEWKRMSKCTEPNFITSPYGAADNSYTMIDSDEINKTGFRYCMKALGDAAKMHPYRSMDIFNHIMMYLAECSVHPQIEYLIKTGFYTVVEAKLKNRMCGVRLNWRSNNVKKVLGMNTEEMNLLKSRPIEDISRYKELKKLDPKSKPADVLGVITSSYQSYYFVVNVLIKQHGETCASALKYIKKNKCKLNDWEDYVRQCQRLGYDLNDPAVFKPSKLLDAHERCTTILDALREEQLRKENAEKDKQLKKLNRKRKIFEYIDEEHNLAVVLPECIQDIIDEGKALVHCVGGYAGRHADGKLNILFVRKIGEEKTPYYTMEVDLDCNIIQCRGFKNDRFSEKPESVKEFEEKYQRYLDALFFYKIEPERFRERRKKKKKTEKVMKTA